MQCFSEDAARRVSGEKSEQLYKSNKRKLSLLSSLILAE